jgi:hypothetical protein
MWEDNRTNRWGWSTRKASAVLSSFKKDEEKETRADL